MTETYTANTPYTPFTRYNRLSNRFDNRLDACLHDTAGIQPCWTNSHCSFNRLSNLVVQPVWQPVWQPSVYTIQLVVKLVVKRVWQPVECLYTRYNTRYTIPAHSDFIFCAIQILLLTYLLTYNRLSNRFDNRFDNRLYRV